MSSTAVMGAGRRISPQRSRPHALRRSAARAVSRGASDGAPEKGTDEETGNRRHPAAERRMRETVSGTPSLTLCCRHLRRGPPYRGRLRRDVLQPSGRRGHQVAASLRREHPARRAHSLPYLATILGVWISGRMRGGAKADTEASELRDHLRVDSLARNQTRSEAIRIVAKLSASSVA